MVDISKWEGMVKQYLAKGKEEDAVQLLSHLIAKYAEIKDFAKADALRNKLLEVAPMALAEITKTAEIIEKKKSEAIDPGLREIWSELFGLLSPDEVNALYHDTERAVYDSDQIIYNQGQFNANLYLIHHGSAKMVYRQGKREFLLKTLGSGSVAGEDTFFSMAMCTTSLIALSKVTLSFLRHDVLKGWEKDFPALESRLKDYCNKFKKVHELIKNQGLERRKYKRISLSGKAAMQVMDASEAPVGKPVKGELSDLSIGGVCFLIKASGHDSARLLLGRKIKTKFLLPENSPQKEMVQKGIVVAVGYHLFNDYSVHVKFDNLLPGNAEAWIESQFVLDGS